MERQVIFVGGTRYSGSTMLDLMLGTGNGFSCGEVFALFYPFRPHHYSPLCGCGDADCRIWEYVREQGEAKVYDSVFARFSSAQFAVDSSKNLAWYRRQARNLQRRNGTRVLNVLIWKSPLEYAYSCWKRKKARGWKSSWINYHKSYFSTTEDWCAVRYRDLARRPDVTLKSLCHRLGIGYFSGKERYWEHNHHTLFGSASARIHLYDRDSADYLRIAKGRARFKPNLSETEIAEISHHQEFYYDAPSLDRLPRNIRMAARDVELARIQEVLEVMSGEGSYGTTESHGLEQGFRVALPLHVLQETKLRLASVLNTVGIRPHWFIPV